MKTKVLSYRVIIEKDGKYYHGYVPSLPGCHTQGDTIDETRINLKEAIELWLETRTANNQSIPEMVKGFLPFMTQTLALAKA